MAIEFDLSVNARDALPFTVRSHLSRARNRQCHSSGRKETHLTPPSPANAARATGFARFWGIRVLRPGDRRNRVRDGIARLTMVSVVVWRALRWKGHRPAGWPR